MANLGAGIISSVTSSPGIDLIPQAKIPMLGEKDFFQFSMYDKQIKVKPIITGILGKQSSLLEPVINNRFKAR